MSDTRPLIDPGQEPDMTWQQKQDFGQAVEENARKSKGSHCVAANQASPSVSTIGTSDVEAIVSDHHQHKPNRQAHPLRESTSASAIEPTSPTTTHENATVSPKPPRKGNNSRRRHKRSAKNSNMGEVPARAYIPPHLRKSLKPASAPIAKAEASVDTNESSAASVGQADKLHSSPNGTSTASCIPPSPPSTPRGPEARSDKHEKVEVAPAPQKIVPPQEVPNVKDVWVGWDVPKPDQPQAASKKEHPRWPRTRGPPKKHVWLKTRDIKAQPSASSSDGGVTFRSNSDGDPDYDVKKLMDWNGDWLPPPEQWSARKGHTARHDLGYGVELWINGHSKMCIEPIPTDSVDFLPEEGICQEIVPRYWIVTSIEQSTLAAFWKSMPAREPSALSDISAHPPFWERYAADDTGNFIQGIPAPDAHLELSDPDNICAGPGLQATSASRVKLMREVRARAERKALLRQSRPIPEFKRPTTPMPDRRIIPDCNLYIRPVQPADVAGIAIIYNHYVDSSIHANEFEQRTHKQIGNRIDATIKAGLPFLVAILRGNQPRDSQAFVSEKIIGYASLDDYCDQSSMYRYTFELDLYTHPGYLRKKVAGCLLDRLLELANTGYNACGGYQYKNDFEYLKTGIGRVIKTILLTLHTAHDEDDKWAREFLKRFNFVRSGHISHIGYKLGKVVDAHLYKHLTTETIDPSQRPTGLLERD